jgi:hypothetical protein
MNNLSLFPAIVPTMIDTTAKTPSRFIESNTREMDFLNLRRDCIIPVFSKDNESTICHTQFIEAMVSAVTGFFRHDAILRPAVPVSHPIKGRIPEALSDRCPDQPGGQGVVPEPRPWLSGWQHQFMEPG